MAIPPSSGLAARDRPRPSHPDDGDEQGHAQGDDGCGQLSPFEDDPGEGADESENSQDDDEWPNELAKSVHVFKVMEGGLLPASLPKRVRSRVLRQGHCVEKRHRSALCAVPIGGRVPYAGGVGPRRTEVILAAVVMLSLAVIIALAQTDPEAVPRPLSYVFAFGFGVVLLLRRGLPKTVVVLSVLGTFAYYSLDLTPIGVALPVVAAFYSAAEVGLTRFAVGAGTIVFVVSTGFRIRDDSLPLGRLLGAESISTLALIAAAITLGYAMATHRRFLAQQETLLRLQDERLTEEADLRMQSERLQLSRDLHDTLGHKLSVISLHANVGIEALERGRGESRDRNAAEDQVSDRAAEALERVHDEAAASCPISGPWSVSCEPGMRPPA